MSEPFIGQICFFGFNFQAQGWSFCSGQLISIADNDTLFNLLGTTYGGDGQTTFALPDLRGRMPIGMGNASFGTYVIGQVGGAEQTTMTVSQMPSHNHTIAVNNIAGTAPTPSTSSVLGVAQSSSGVTAKIFTTANAGNTTLAPATIGSQGGSQPFSILQPSLVANYSISLFGVYPSQN